MITQQELQARLNRAAADFHLPGAAIALIKGGQTLTAVGRGVVILGAATGRKTRASWKLNQAEHHAPPPETVTRDTIGSD